MKVPQTDWPLVFVSGAYSEGDRSINVRRAITAGNHILDREGVPFVPHLFHFWHRMFSKKREIWLNMDIKFLSLCSFLVVCPYSDHSQGVVGEINYAVAHGIPIVEYDGMLELTSFKDFVTDNVTIVAPSEASLDGIAESDMDYE